MTLASDIQALRERTAAAFVEAHDYYAGTIIARNLADHVIAGGRTFSITSDVTGSLISHNTLVAKSQEYIDGHLREPTFQQFLAVFESFIFDFLRLWLTAHPQSLGKKTIDFKTILDAPDKDAITEAVVTKELVEVLYKRPAEWFEYVEAKAKLGCPTADEIAALAEAKATRDVLTHNRGVVNAVYVQKAGPLARSQVGDRIEITEAYHRRTWNLLGKLVADLCDAALAKSV